MEIAWLEFSTQKHLDRMQETAKVNYVQYGKGPKSKEVLNQGPVAAVVVVAAVSMLKNTVAAMSMLVKPNTRERSSQVPTEHMLEMWESKTQKKVRSARYLSQSAGIVESRDTTRKFA